MNINRRDFVKGCAAASVLLVPGIASVAQAASANTPATSADLNIEKSIKASFGGGFSLQAHTESNGLTYAKIEHFGNRYAVTSTDLLDWTIVAPL
ncbi:twin-arginine translocation signal domain-containing protein [Alcaligenaceae bacterium]|nr:twin-arginine translocation signal domain-containing protein [Alcaligenaceae bacterium]